MTVDDRLMVEPEQYVGVKLDTDNEGEVFTTNDAVEPVAVQPLVSVTNTV